MANTLKYASLLLTSVLCLSLGVICSQIAGTAEASAPSQWIDYAGNPVFDPTARAYYPTVCYDVDRFSGHGDAVYYKMWFNSNKGAGGNYSIGYAISNNGISWTEVMNPVNGLASRPGHPMVKYNSNGFGSSVYYKIWYWDEGANIYSIDALRYAESADGINWTNDQPLTQDAAARLLVDLGTNWNRGSYGPCDIIYNPIGSASLDDSNIWNNKYVMYYMATNGANEFIGIGYSANGTHWKIYGANPILEPCTLANDPSCGWDYYSVGYATVIKDSSGLWMMWYCGGPGANHGIGYATSADGIQWTKDPNNPLFHKNDGNSWRSDRTYTPRVVFDADHFNCHGDCASYKMWYSGRNSAGNYAVGYTKAKTEPAVITDDATAITSFGAILNGNLTSTGTASTVNVSFVWGTNPGGPYPNETNIQARGANGIFNSKLTVLRPGITYYYRAKAVGDGTIYGLEKSFKTSDLAMASVAPRAPATLKPAQMSVQYLSIIPKQTYAGQPITITPNVVNSGDQAGNYNVVLKINGQVEQSKMVSVGPHGAQPVRFTVTKAQPGTYTVDIGGQRGIFTVGGQSNGTSGSSAVGGLIAIFIVGVLVLATLVALVMRFR